MLIFFLYRNQYKVIFKKFIFFIFMNKQIRILVENFFDDDIFDVKKDIKKDIESLGELYIDNYNIGDIYYKNNEPYAICCGDRSNFSDYHSRFCLLNLNYNIYYTDDLMSLSLYPQDFKQISKKINLYNNVNISFGMRNKVIDDKGFENTKLLLDNITNIKDYPVLQELQEINDNNVYLPAINEISSLNKNSTKLMKILKKKLNYFPHFFTTVDIWSSTFYSLTEVFIINISGYITTTSIFKEHSFIPFLKIK